jgi:hypothetical protein
MIEMRRRIWWQIIILDARSSEDQGLDPTIVETITDTQFPRNLNDNDFDMDTKDMPESRKGCTEMTFGLMRFKISSVLRRIQYVPAGFRGKRCFGGKFGHGGFGGFGGHHGPHGPNMVEKKKEMIEKLQQELEDQYLKDCDLTVPIYWVIATVSRLIISKMWLVCVPGAPKRCVC